MNSLFEWIAQFWRDRTTLLVVVLAGLGTAHILVRTATYGVAVGTDSVIYLSTALNFLAGEGWRDFTGEPLTMWPPLISLLLAASSWVGIDPLATTRWGNAAAFGLTILAAGCWLRSHLRSQWLTLAATAIIAVSLPLSYWASSLQTETLFFLFTLLALMQLVSFLNQRTAAPLWWAAIFTGLAAITRYPGVVLIGTGVLLLLPRARLRQTLVFGAVSSLPLLAVLVRNWAATGHLTRAAGHRTEPTGQSLADGLRQIVEVFHEWLVPRHTPDGFAYLLWLAVAAVVLASAAVILRTSRRPDPDALGPALPFGAFTGIYLAFMVATVPFTVRQGIDSRYLMPIYVPLLLVAALLLDRSLSIKAAGRMVAVRYGLASLVVLGALTHIGFSAQKNLRLTATAYAIGFRAHFYHAARWQHSETLNYLRNNRIEGRIYSNEYRDLTWFADRTAAPEKLGKHRNIPCAMAWTEVETGAHIFWLGKFGEFYRRDIYGYDVTDLCALPGMKIVAELADGVVLRRTAYEPFDGKRHRARKQRYVNQLIQQADERVVRAGWNVYRTGRKLIYRKEPCAPADTQAKFVLHVVPTDPANLRADRQRYGSENLDFHFGWYGSYLGDQCVAIVRLPNYAMDRIHIGQWISAENRTLWEAELTPGTGRSSD